MKLPEAVCDRRANRRNQLSDGEPSCDVISDVAVRQGAVKKCGPGACGGDDNYSNDDVRSLAELGEDYNGLIDVIEDELCAMEGWKAGRLKPRKADRLVPVSAGNQLWAMTLLERLRPRLPLEPGGKRRSG